MSAAEIRYQDSILHTKRQQIKVYHIIENHLFIKSPTEAKFSAVSFTSSAEALYVILKLSKSHFASLVWEMYSAPVKKHHQLLDVNFGIYKLFPGASDASGKSPDFCVVQEGATLNTLCKIKALQLSSNSESVKKPPWI